MLVKLLAGLLLVAASTAAEDEQLVEMLEMSVNESLTLQHAAFITQEDR